MTIPTVWFQPDTGHDLIAKATNGNPYVQRNQTFLVGLLQFSIEENAAHLFDVYGESFSRLENSPFLL